MSEVALIFIGIGILFDLFGCIGLLRMPDVYNRLQAATKCVTLGTWGILFGVFLHFGFTSTGVKALVGIPLLFLVSTVAAHSLARGAYVFGIKLCKKSVKDDYRNIIKQGKGKK